MQGVRDTRDAAAVVDRLRGGGQVLATWCSIDSPSAVEAVSLAGFGAVLLDLEHGEFTTASLPDLLRAVEVGGASGVVRVASTAQLGVALDAGAAGVLVPDVRSADTAREVVRACTYPPEGTRGAAPMTRDLRYGHRPFDEHVSTTSPLVGVQVEGPEGVDALKEVLAVPGLDLVFLGAQDLSVRLGVPGQLDHPELGRLVAEVAARARAAGVATGVWAPDVALASRWLHAGVSLVSVSNVTVLLASAARRLVDALPVPR